MKFSTAALGAAGLLLAASPASAQDLGRLLRNVGVSATTGIDYSSGDYGAVSDTEIVAIPFSLRAKTGPLTLRATLPWLRIDGPANIVGGGEGGPIIIDPNDPTPREVRKGLGDLSLSASYTLPEAALGGFEVDIGGRIKLPTSSESRRLGTGETDYALSLDVARPIGNVAPFANVSYRWRGDPEGIELRNGFATSVGATVGTGPVTLIGSYDFSEAASALSEDAHSLFLGAYVPVSERFALTGYGTAGLSNGAPDYGVGLLLTARIF